MARYQIELNGQPISMETFSTREAAEDAMIQHYLKVGPQQGTLCVREQPEQIGISFGTPPTGGKG